MVTPSSWENAINQQCFRTVLTNIFLTLTHFYILNLMSPTQKTILITGSSEGGLGDALAQRFHIAGYRVFATARDPNKLINLFPGIFKLVLDVTSEAEIKTCVAEVSEMTGGTLDVLLNNAGAGYVSSASA